MKTAKQYRIQTVPSYFSNISSINRLAVLHDAPIEDDRMQLQLYFNDLYQVFLKRFSAFAYADYSTEECDQMITMFQEILKVKALLSA